MRGIHRNISAIVAGAALGAMLGGCVYHHQHRPPDEQAEARKGGPPPWAPAHGYRHKHQGGVDLVFDSDLEVYVVVGYPGHYFHRDRYYRHVDGHWRIGLSINGLWSRVRLEAVPTGIRHRHEKPKHRGKRGRGHGPPAKHR